ncbi:hypothetical protein [uncultured Cohaesibacter sp.]|uniref:hypothetical protein n=1 Tax=uncultured Cohaesibacter sp. TaxID=1002546 RepID=UPI0029C845BE|nr:hypothetical protein [uncultured Cohaesibacter sp.]
MLSDILSNFLKRIDKKLAGIFLFNIATFGIAVWALVETIDQGKQSTEALIEAKKQTDFIIEQRKNEILVNNNISTKERCEIIYENINSNKNMSNIKFGPCKLDNIATSSEELIDLKFNKVELSNLKLNSSDIDGTWFEDVSMDNLVLNDVKKFHSTFINSEINKLTISNVLYGSPKIKSNSHIGELNLNNSRLSSIAIYSSIVENTKFTNSEIGVMYSNGNFSIGNNVNINIDKLTIGTDSTFHNSYFNEANINSLDGSGYQLSEIIFFWL